MENHDCFIQWTKSITLLNTVKNWIALFKTEVLQQSRNTMIDDTTKEITQATTI